jgi:hypothetical protein
MAIDFGYCQICGAKGRVWLCLLRINGTNITQWLCSTCRPAKAS